MTLFMAIKWRLRRSFHLAPLIRYSYPLHIRISKIKWTKPHRPQLGVSLRKETTRAATKKTMLLWKRRCWCWCLFLFYRLLFSHTRSAPSTSVLSVFFSSARPRNGSAAWRLSCGLGHVWYCHIIHSLIQQVPCLPTRKYFPRCRKSPRPSSAHLSPLFSPPDGWRECHKKRTKWPDALYILSFAWRWVQNCVHFFFLFLTLCCIFPGCGWRRMSRFKNSHRALNDDDDWQLITAHFSRFVFKWHL